VIDPTDEMLVAWRDAMKAAAADAVKAGEPLGRSQEVARAGAGRRPRHRRARLLHGAQGPRLPPAAEGAVVTAKPRRSPHIFVADPDLTAHPADIEQRGVCATCHLQKGAA
jgi:hypothetical protein